MVASRASRLGWIAVMLLGQQHGRASGQSTCASITVSGVGDLDGTYTLDSSVSNPFYFRAGGTTTYEVYQSNGAWFILDSRTSDGLKTDDPAQHPADIVDGWVECTSTLSCDLAESLSQPTITCADPIPEPDPSTCASIAVSDIGDLDGEYDLDSSISSPFYFRAGGTTTYEVYKSNGAWFILDSRTSDGLRTYDPAQHPADIALEWADCTSTLSCDLVAGLLQPNITCGDPIPEPDPSTCASIAVSGVRDLDGTYTLDSSISYPYYFRAGGTTTYEVYKSNGAWFILDSRTSDGLRTYDPAQHPADIALEWADCTSTLSCDLAAGLLQPNITCADPIPEPDPSTCASIAVSGVRDLDGAYDLDSSISYPYYFRAGGSTTYEVYKSNGAWFILDSRTSDGHRTYDPAQHPADIALEWVDCTSTLSCDLVAGLLQPNITCGAVAPTPAPTAGVSPSPTTSPIEEAVATDSPSSLGNTPTPSPANSLTPSPANSLTPSPEDPLAPSPENPLTPSPVDSAPVAAPAESVPAPITDDDDAEGNAATVPNGDGSSGDDDYAMEVLIGVVSTLASAVMIGFS